MGKGDCEILNICIFAERLVWIVARRSSLYYDLVALEEFVGFVTR